MAQFEQALGGASPGIINGLELDEISNNIAANTSVVRIIHYARTQSGTRSGSYDANEVLDGSTKRSVTNVGYSWGTGNTILYQGDFTISHDANGNRSVGGSAYLDWYYSSGTISGSINLARLPLAPSIAANTADQIKPTSVRLGTEINNVGHGTSASTHMLYRLQGTSTWSQTSDQADAAGYNYWTVTGLKPGKTYEYASVWWNNNGDTVQSGTQTFKTKSVPGMIPVLMGLLT